MAVIALDKTVTPIAAADAVAPTAVLATALASLLTVLAAVATVSAEVEAAPIDLAAVQAVTALVVSVVAAARPICASLKPAIATKMLAIAPAFSVIATVRLPMPLTMFPINDLNSSEAKAFFRSLATIVNCGATSWKASKKLACIVALTALNWFSRVWLIFAAAMAEKPAAFVMLDCSCSSMLLKP